MKRLKKPGRGGNRPGAGRPRAAGPPRKDRGFYITDEEWAWLREMLDHRRKNVPPDD